MWKFYPKVLFVYLNDNQCTRPFRWWLWWFNYFFKWKNNLLLLTVYSRWCPLLWMNRWRKRKVIALATKKKLWLRLYGMFIVRSTFKNQLVYQSFSNQVLGCRSSISWSSRSRSSHVRSIHPVPDLHRVYALKIRDHSPPTVAGAYQLWCDHFFSSTLWWKVYPLVSMKNKYIYHPPVYDI